MLPCCSCCVVGLALRGSVLTERTKTRQRIRSRSMLACCSCCVVRPELRGSVLSDVCRRRVCVLLGRRVRAGMRWRGCERRDEARWGRLLGGGCVGRALAGTRCVGGRRDPEGEFVVVLRLVWSVGFRLPVGRRGLPGLCDIEGDTGEQRDRRGAAARGSGGPPERNEPYGCEWS